VLCQITSNSYSDPGAVALVSASFAQGGLSRESFARPGKLFTASESIVVRRVGLLSEPALKGVVSTVVQLLQGAQK
jgi:mRNA interferase MazF